MNPETQDDLALLREYAATGSAPAFAQVVAKYADVVFATALRHTRSRALAEDVTQAAFIVLARRAASLRPDASVAAFLHQTTLFAAKNALRAQSRRRRHESRAATNAATYGGDEPADENVVAVDRALVRLRDSDRSILMLHYFDGLSMEETAKKLGIAHEAARKRLHRALERLRTLLQRQGVTAAAIPATLTALANPHAPANATAVASMAIAGGADGNAFTLALEVIHTMKRLALQKAAIAVAAVLVVATTTAVVIQRATQPAKAMQNTAPSYVRPATPTQPTAGEVIDYNKVFSEMQHAKDERARLERMRTSGNQAEMEKQQSKAMVELFGEIERAVSRVAAEQGVKLTPTSMPALPKNLEQRNVNQIRAILNTRRLHRPEGAPDLTDKVLSLLDREYKAQIQRPTGATTR